VRDRESYQEMVRMTDEEIEALPPYPGRARSNGYLGFAFQESTRYKIFHTGLNERFYCECSELCDEGLWDEAWDKLDQYEATCTYKPSAKLQASVVKGRFLHTTSFESLVQYEKAFQNACNVIAYHLSNDGGVNDEEICRDFEEVISKYAEVLLDAGSGSTKKEHVFAAGEAWLTYVKIVDACAGICDNSRGIFDSSDDEIRSIMDKFLAMKEPKAGFQLGQKACKTYPTEELRALFYACTAECAEVDCDKESAHKYYKILSKLPDGDHFYVATGPAAVVVLRKNGRTRGRWRLFWLGQISIRMRLANCILVFGI